MLSACQQSQSFKSLTLDEFEVLITDYTVQRLDVHTEAEYSEGHLLGAININVMDKHSGQIADELLSKESPVVHYCKSGRCSKVDAQKLTEVGYEVYDLKGIQGWKESGKEVVK